MIHGPGLGVAISRSTETQAVQEDLVLDDDQALAKTTLVIGTKGRAAVCQLQDVPDHFKIC